MTMEFDEKARRKLLSEYVSRDYSNIKPHDMNVREISCQTARGYISAFHYSRTMPDSSRFVYGLFAQDTLVGVCVFGMGCGKNQYTSVFPDIQNGEYIELTRLWCEETLGRNSESYFISKCLKQLPKEIKIVISFSDTKQHHVGYIYQATNWIYLGINRGGRMLINKDGYEAHPRLLGIYRMRHPELKDVSSDDLMDILGLQYVISGAKHKYIFIRDKKLRKSLNIKYLPYPKGDTGKTDNTAMLNSQMYFQQSLFCDLEGC